MYQDVLIPTDGSDGTRRAIAHGLTIADRFDATVHALSVVPEGPLGTLESDEAERAAQRAVARVEADAQDDGLSVTTAVRRGVPHEEILDYADEQGVDLIIMGTQGRTGLDRVLVGSVTERLVRMADVPVVTVRLTDEIRIEDVEEATRLARETAEDAGHADVSIVGEPHRTSGSWIVNVETESGLIQVAVDAVSGDVRIAERGD
ncbi:universal stress protein [Halosolutus amylolyticus]|uniref:Universal stress protein n=1 Tax=Halosolutus amylolyticus TaxID=2932267 RepID=A0ABD5PSW4_9EURY|nr:universal stress protein [Halosolutus amylolyticus]